MSYNYFEEMPVWRKAMDMAAKIFYFAKELPKTISFFDGLLKNG